MRTSKRIKMKNLKEDIANLEAKLEKINEIASNNENSTMISEANSGNRKRIEEELNDKRETLFQIEQFNIIKKRLKIYADRYDEELVKLESEKKDLEKEKNDIQEERDNIDKEREEILSKLAKVDEKRQKRKNKWNKSLEENQNKYEELNKRLKELQDEREELEKNPNIDEKIEEKIKELQEKDAKAKTKEEKEKIRKELYKVQGSFVEKNNRILELSSEIKRISEVELPEVLKDVNHDINYIENIETDSYEKEYQDEEAEIRAELDEFDISKVERIEELDEKEDEIDEALQKNISDTEFMQIDKKEVLWKMSQCNLGIENLLSGKTWDGIDKKEAKEIKLRAKKDAFRARVRENIKIKEMMKNEPPKQRIVVDKYDTIFKSEPEKQEESVPESGDSYQPLTKEEFEAMLAGIEEPEKQEESVPESEDSYQPLTPEEIEALLAGIEEPEKQEESVPESEDPYKPLTPEEIAAMFAEPEEEQKEQEGSIPETVTESEPEQGTDSQQQESELTPLQMKPMTKEEFYKMMGVEDEPKENTIEITSEDINNFMEQLGEDYCKDLIERKKSNIFFDAAKIKETLKQEKGLNITDEFALELALEFEKKIRKEIKTKYKDAGESQNEYKHEWYPELVDVDKLMDYVGRDYCEKIKEKMLVNPDYNSMDIDEDIKKQLGKELSLAELYALESTIKEKINEELLDALNPEENEKSNKEPETKQEDSFENGDFEETTESEYKNDIENVDVNELMSQLGNEYCEELIERKNKDFYYVSGNILNDVKQEMGIELTQKQAEKLANEFDRIIMERKQQNQVQEADFIPGKIDNSSKIYRKVQAKPKYEQVDVDKLLNSLDKECWNDLLDKCKKAEKYDYLTVKDFIKGELDIDLTDKEATALYFELKNQLKEDKLNFKDIETDSFNFMNLKEKIGFNTYDKLFKLQEKAEKGFIPASEIIDYVLQNKGIEITPEEAREISYTLEADYIKEKEKKEKQEQERKEKNKKNKKEPKEEMALVEIPKWKQKLAESNGFFGKLFYKIFVGKKQKEIIENTRKEIAENVAKMMEEEKRQEEERKTAEKIQNTIDYATERVLNPPKAIASYRFPTPAPKPEQAQVPESTPVPKPEQAQAPESTPVPKPEQAQVSESTPVPKPEQAQVSESTPAPKPEQAQVPESTPAPKPEQAQVPELTPAPKPKQVQISKENVGSKKQESEEQIELNKYIYGVLRPNNEFDEELLKSNRKKFAENLRAVTTSSVKELEEDAHKKEVEKTEEARKKYIEEYVDNANHAESEEIEAKELLEKIKNQKDKEIEEARKKYAEAIKKKKAAQKIINQKEEEFKEIRKEQRAKGFDREIDD